MAHRALLPDSSVSKRHTSIDNSAAEVASTLSQELALGETPIMTTTIFTESFETPGNGSRYTTSVAEFSDGTSDFFTRTDGSNISGTYDVLNPDGSFYFAAQDLDGEGATLPVTLSFSGIDIAGFATLNFSTLLAEDDSSDGNEDWDASDSVLIEYQIDGNGFQDLLKIANDGSTFNSAPSIDTDFDGTGDGMEITDTFTTFGNAIAGTGSTLDLRITFDLNAGDEDIAIDNLQITGDTATTTPDLSINELRISSSGSSDDDSNFVEIFGGSGTSLDGVSLVVLSGEFEPGQVDFAFDLTGLTIDEDNLLLVANPGIGNEIPEAVTEDNDLLTEFDFFGSPSSFLLVESFTGAQGDDLDTNNDGILDSEIGTVIDSVSLIDGDSTPDQNYSDTVVGPSGNFPPAGIARNPDETGDFEQLAFDSLIEDTPGTLNVVEPPPEITPIFEIQGAAQTSPLEGQSVTTEGIVTAVDTNGFYLQDANGDDNVATADGIFVFTGSSPSLSVGDAVQVSGTVSEFIPGGASTGNLSITQISGSPTITALSSGNSLPTPVVLGVDRLPPTQVIDDDLDNLYNVLDGEGTYEPNTDGIDFYESLEGMRVTLNQPVAVAGTTGFGEIFSAVNNGANATGLSDRGTLNLSPDDFNPERIQIDDDSFTPGDIPIVDTGAELNDVTGVVSYSFGNFEVLATEAVTVAGESALTPEISSIVSTQEQLTVASYNVLNLDPNDSDGDSDIADGRFTAIANDIVSNLNNPDVIGLQEVQDNDGSDNTSVTAANETLQQLVDEIANISGVTYEFIDNPFIGDDTSGGQPGGNIRTAFLYNPNRVSLSGDPLLEQPFAGSVQTAVDPQDQQNNPDNPFFNSRLPLIGFFSFNGQEIAIANNHFTSKGGSSPLLGALQPAVDLQEDATINGNLDDRREQAQALQDYLANLTNENIAAIGDFNEFEFLSPLEILEQNLTNLTETLPADERYSFNFQGNSQAIDHILVSDALTEAAVFDAVHVNTEFAATDSRASDHDPILAGLKLGTTVNVIEGTRNDDRLVGTNEADFIAANNGNDIVYARGGNDTVEGGRGGDLIRGGAGDDLLAADRVDRFDDFDGTASDLRGNDGNDTIFGGAKDDSIFGGQGNDSLLGKNGDDDIRANDGDDLLNGGVGNDRLDGSLGVDTADYSDLAIKGVFGTVPGVDANLRTRVALHSSTNNPLAFTDEIIGIENIIGTQRNDRFVGNARDNLFDGRGERSDRQTTFTALDGEPYQVNGDVVEYTRNQNGFEISGSPDNFTLSRTGVGVDTLIDIEFVKFGDALVATSDLSFA